MSNLVFGFSCLLLLLQLLSFFTIKRFGRGFFNLLLICSVFWGAVFYFFYGFPLDEGTAAAPEIPVYERNFAVSAILLITSVLLFIARFFVRKK